MISLVTGGPGLDAGEHKGCHGGLVQIPGETGIKMSKIISKQKFRDEIRPSLKAKGQKIARHRQIRTTFLYEQNGLVSAKA